MATQLGWLSGVTSDADLPAVIDLTSQLPANNSIVSVTLLPIHIDDKDPQPEPWNSLTISISGTTFTIANEAGGSPRASINWFMWQVSYAPSDPGTPGYTALAWVSGYTSGPGLPASIPVDTGGHSIIAATVIPVHIYDGNPKMEPWDGLGVTVADEMLNIWEQSDNTRDKIAFFMWQATLGTVPPGCRTQGWFSGATSDAGLPQTIQTIAPSLTMVSAVVFPIHIYDKAPIPEPWPSLSVEIDPSGNQL